MKNILAIFALGLVCWAACTNKTQSMGDQNTPPPSFGTPEEAVQQAKKDLLEVLRTSPGIDLGVDAATAEQSEPGKPIPHFDVDFNRLMDADSAATLDQLRGPAGTTLAPLVVGDKIAVMVEVVKGDKGWQVAGIGNKEISEGLNAVAEATGAGRGNIQVMNVPNLNATIYAVTTPDGAVSYHTDYAGKFDLRKGVDGRTLTAVLREDARAFFKEYGDLLKKQELVK
ncbi:MAG: hypothetical protein SFV52_13810 [Saprospiraceae bacterium]|nr:hypothetical protein [Saprospiraceae bacterium]